MWWFIILIAVTVVTLTVILARRGSSGGAIGHNTPYVDPRGQAARGDSGLGGA